MDPMPRRAALAGMGGLGAATLAGHAAFADAPQDEIWGRVSATPLVDTHEHLIEERERLQGASHPRVGADDWSLLLSHYLNSDLLVAGMPREAYDRLFSPRIDPADKWAVVEPFWPAVKNTGYALAARLAVRSLYDVDDISATTVARIQQGYDHTRRPGFYERVLREHAGVESCQVNCLDQPFSESPMPTLLMQDISILGMYAGPDVKRFAGPAGIEVRSLGDWHRVIDWWMATFGPYAVAVKSQHAYSRDIDYRQVPAETVEGLFVRRLAGEPLDPVEQKSLEDHLFWRAVGSASGRGLPVKLHTGYYAGNNYMPLGRLAANPASASDLCRAAPETNFVFMHIGYPYYEEMITLAKHYSNAYIDMCWAWIIDPVAAADFLAKFLVTAPSNKILTFGGDYIPVELVVGHAQIARRGIALALRRLVDDGWTTLADALELVDPLLHGNARRLFALEAKSKALRQAPWLEGRSLYKQSGRQ